MATLPVPFAGANVQVDEQGRFIRVNGRTIPRQNPRVRMDVVLNAKPPELPARLLENNPVFGGRPG